MLANSNHIRMAELVYQTGRVWTSRPAKKGGRSVKRKKNSNADVMYIYMCACVSCSVVMLFTCTSVGSHPDRKEGVRCEIRSVEINSKILGAAWQQEICSERETNRRLSLSLDRDHEGHIRDMPQEDGCSSMYKS
jgi:hypothetical protein